MAAPPPFEASNGMMKENEKADHTLQLKATNNSMEEGFLDEVDETKNGQFHRSFTPHQIHIISLGSNIGSGLFIATGGALATAGPGNMVIAYFLVCTCVWGVLETLSEMTIAFPTSGNYIDYADRWVDPALAFGAGFAEWLGWTAIVGAESGFFNILVQFWGGGDFPQAASLSLFVAATIIIFTMPNKIFAYFEYVTSLVKIFIYLLLIVLSLAIVLGAGPNGYVHKGINWTELGAFKNGFGGFAHASLLATWAVGDQIFIGIMGGEAQNPRFSMGHATTLVPYRVIFVYMSCVIFITLIVPSNDPHLLGGGGVAASPFVLAIQSVGIPGISSVVNACIMVGILAISAESVYLASRILRTMSNQKLIPEWIAQVDSKGRPRRALIITCLSAVVLTYINLSAGGAVALNWLVSITSASFFTNWIVVSITSWRFRQAIKAQNDPLFSEVYAWQSPRYPLAPAWLMLMSLFLLVCCIYSGVSPLGGSGFTAYNFFEYMLGFVMIVVLSLIYKVAFRTPWRDPATADLRSGRRPLHPDEIKQLDDYYAMPKYRRFLTYVSLW